MREIKKHAVDRSALKQDQQLNDAESRKEGIAEEYSETTNSFTESAHLDDPPIKQNKNKPKKGRGKTALILVAVVVLLAVTCFKIYVDNDYEPLHSHDEYQKLTEVEIEFSDNIIALEDLDQAGDAKKTGFIFYGDDKIQRDCYLPLMIKLANMGYSVYLPTTFGNIPILNLEGAEYVSRTYPHVKNWYLVAHGKACPVAAKYASSHTSKLKGLIFLGGYTKTDLSGKKLRLLSINGTNDTVMDQQAYLASKSFDPSGTVYIEIEGGNHTGFTDTFLIRKDTEAAISSEEQIQLTATVIESFVTAQ